jgi:1,6-anhydro-N-acetylmuramate kinase
VAPRWTASADRERRQGAVSARAGATYPYPSQLRKKLQAVIADPETAEQAPFDDVEAEVTQAHGDVIVQFLADTGHRGEQD